MEIWENHKYFVLSHILYCWADKAGLRIFEIISFTFFGWSLNFGLGDL